MIQTVMKSLTGMFCDLRFDEARHMYFVNGENYPSVSRKLEDHEHPFDEDYWLPICAVKENTTIDLLRQQWRDKNKRACDLGHDVHTYLENYGNGITREPILPQEKAGVQFLNDYILNPLPEFKGRYMLLTQEFRMIHRRYKFCGTTDMLLWDTWTNTIIIADWKTNEDLFKTYGCLKYPFNMLASNPFNHYQLQLNYYQLMVEQSRFEVSERWIIYLSAEGQYSVHKVLDFRKELIEYLENPEVEEPVEASYGLTF